MRTRLVALSLVAVAGCSGGSAGDTTVVSEAPSTSVSPSSTVSPSTTVTTGPQTTVTTSDRPLAPDFTLELGDGGQYSLAEGVKPVYLVFWAEW